MMKNKKSKKSKKKGMRQIQEKILNIAIALAKKGEGALFIIGDDINYSRLVKQKIEPFSIFDNGAEKILRSIATIDGAIIINREGYVMGYGVMIKGTVPFPGYGTRHAAAMTASKKGNIAILCSEEECKVKIFKNGRLIMQLDALQKNIEKNIPKVASILESVGAGLIGTIGTAALVPALGITLIPGVIVFGAGYFAVKTIINHVKRAK